MTDSDAPKPTPKIKTVHESDLDGELDDPTIVSLYIPGQAPGAIPNGHRFVKLNDEPGDAHHKGSQGVVVASHDVSKIVLPNGIREQFFYFVIWDDLPHRTVGVRGSKIGPV